MSQGLQLVNSELLNEELPQQADQAVGNKVISPQVIRAACNVELSLESNTEEFIKG